MGIGLGNNHIIFILQAVQTYGIEALTSFIMDAA